VHVLLVVAKTVSRPSWRLPPWQLVQIVSGLAVPALLFPHILATRGAEEMLGVEVGYRRLLTLVWPNGVLLQTLLIAIVWLHGCVGIHAWLRLKPWYGRLAPILGWCAVAIAVFALTGFVSAARMVEAENAARRYVPLPALQWITRESHGMQLVSLLAGIALLFSPLARPFLKRLRSEFSVTYDGDRKIHAGYGQTLLEVSREAGVPHASACGGRARCSTCRVQILSGLSKLPAPGIAEARLLDRIAAPPDVRLACQTRPMGDVTVRLLVGGSRVYDPASASDPYRWGVEREVAVMFADLRGFTRLTERRLAYDVVHLLNAYFERAARVVAARGGQVDKFMGDGLMALFAIDEPIEAGARHAAEAALDLLDVIAALNAELGAELDEPLRVAIGLHSGPAILGRIGGGEANAAFTALGDTVNTAARLEGVAKAEDAVVCASERLMKAAGLDASVGQRLEADIRGRQASVAVRLFSDPDALKAALGATIAA
jgi:adenylate cyclase